MIRIYNKDGKLNPKSDLSIVPEYEDSKWGHAGGIGKDPKRKRLPQSTIPQKKRNTEPRPSYKMMAKKRNRG